MNLSSSLSSFGAFLLLGFMVLTMTLNDALAKDDAQTGKDDDKATPGFDVSSIVSDIIGSRRTVLLFASLPNRLLVIVSAPDQTGLTSDAVVFEQPSTTLTGTSLTLTSGQLLKDKWPQLNLTAGSLSILSDNSAQYLAIADSGQLHLFNLETKAPIPYKAITSNLTKEYFTKTILLSSSESMSVYSLYHDDYIGMLRGTFGGSAWTSFTQTQRSASSKHLCKSGQATFIWINIFAKCPTPLTWRITAGALIDWFVYLVDASTLSIIKFEKSGLSNKTVTFTSIPFDTFWATPPTVPRPTTTHKASRWSCTPTSHTATIIILVIILVAILIAVLILYLVCRPKNGQPASEGTLYKIPLGGKQEGVITNGKMPATSNWKTFKQSCGAFKCSTTKRQGSSQRGVTPTGKSNSLLKLAW